MNPHQVIRTKLPVGGDKSVWGSGYLVAPGVILTAAHVLSDPATKRAQVGTNLQICEWSAEIWHDATVAWVDMDHDVALVRTDGLAVADFSPPRWAKLGLEGAPDFAWTAVGYPHAGIKDHKRRSEQVSGRTFAVTDAPTGLALSVSTRYAREEGPDTSGWAGFSGSAVFSGRDETALEYLIGVVIADAKAWTNSLSGVRVEAFIKDPALGAILNGQPLLETLAPDRIDINVRPVAVALPPATARFVGRAEELAALEATESTQVLVGMGGIGKSALAAHWARDHSDSAHDVDVAWWFLAADRTSLATAMAARYRQVTGRTESGDADADANQLTTWLSNSSYRWIVVFDNVTSPAILDGLLPRSTNGRVLITSRFTEWSSITPAVHTLSRLSVEEASNLLCSNAQQPNDADAQALVLALDCLPLALIQAGAYVRKNVISFARYRALLQQSAARLLAADQTATGQTVAAVLQTSLDQVVALHGQLAAHVLGMLAWFAPNRIPRDLLSPPAIDGEALLAGGDALSVDDALGGLIEYSLVVVSEGALTLHPLISELTRAHPGLDSVNHVATAVRLLDALLAASPASRSLDLTNLTDSLLPHVLEVTRHARELSADPEHCVSLLTRVATNRIDIGQLASAYDLLLQAGDIATGHLGEAAMLPVSLAGARLLKASERPKSRRDAIQLLEAALEAASRLLESHDPLTLDIRFELAECLRRSSLPWKALPQLEALRKDQERLLGPNDRRTLRTRQALGWMAADNGQDQAINAFTQLLTDEERILGADDIETLQTRSDLALEMIRAGYIEEAITRMEALVTDYQRVFGIYDARTLHARTNLANYRGQNKSYDEAIRELQDVLVIRDRVLGPDDADTLAAHEDLAWWLERSNNVSERSNNLSEVISELKKVVAGRERVLGPDDPKTVRARNTLARLQALADGSHASSTPPPATPS